MGDKKRFTSSRKLDHLRICAEKEVESGDTGFGDIRFVHNALPECDMGTIDLSSRFLNREFSSPLFISAMTSAVMSSASALNRVTLFSTTMEMPLA